MEEQIERMMEDLQEVKRAFENNPEDFLDNVHEEIISAAEEIAEDIGRDLDRAQDDLESWWAQNTGSLVLSETDKAAYAFLQSQPKLRIQNLSGVDYQKWSKASTMNLQTRKQNMLNLQSLLIKTGATTPMNLGTPTRSVASLRLEECHDVDRIARDAGGDSCAWYKEGDNAQYCGAFDDNDFKAADHCCACGGSSDAVCQDTNDLERDSANDGCEWYNANPSSCGNHDTTLFFADEMCCVCGGGSIPAATEKVCMDTNEELRDSTGDTCSWYINRTDFCGTFDVEGGFTAKTHCCSCDGGMDQDAVMDEFASGLADLIDANGDDGVPISEEIDRINDDWHHAPCYDDPEWCQIQEIQEHLNQIGRDPKGFLENTKNDLKRELSNAVTALDQRLEVAKRHVIKELSPADERIPMLNLQEMTAEEEAAAVEQMLDGMRAAMDGGLNLAEEVLAAPEWEINMDKEAMRTMVRELAQEAEEWEREMEHITRDWQNDLELLNHYYMTYKMEPHVRKGMKFDEKALRSMITYLANSTQVKGKPINEVFPGVEEMMMSNYDPNERSLWEKMGMFNLEAAEYEEWYAADWQKYQECVEEHDFANEAAITTCDWLDTYDNAFEDGTVNGNWEKYDAFMLNYPTGRVEETATVYIDEEHGPVGEQIMDAEEDLIHEIIQIEQRVEDSVRPMGPVTYSFHFDEEEINSWLENEARMFETINNMYEEQMAMWMSDVEAVNQEHQPKFAEIDERFKSQFDDLIFDASRLFDENFSMDYADEISAIGLAARFESKQESTASNLDYLMYAGAAIASLGVFAWTAHTAIETKKVAAVNNNGAFERLI